MRSKDRFRVHSYFQTNKTVLEVQRIQTHSNEAKKGWHSVQGKTLKTLYTAEKAEAIMSQRVKDGMFYDCDDFPNDPDET